MRKHWMRSVALMICLTMSFSGLLTGCSAKRAALPPRPILPDAALLEDCAPPPLNEAVLPALAAGHAREAGAEYVRYVLDVDAALGRCNERMAGLRTWAATVGGAQ